MACEYGAYTRRGAQILAIVVDPPAVNAAMAEKLALPFPVLSDSDGAGAIKPYGVWHEGRTFAKPAIIVLAPDGREVYRYVGIDFMDRPDDSAVFAALNTLGPPALPELTGTIEHLAPQPSLRAFPLDTLAPYMRGVQMAMTGMAQRARDEADRADAMRVATIAERFIKAQSATRALKRAP